MSISQKTYDVLKNLHLTEDSLKQLTADEYLHYARIIIKSITDDLQSKVKCKATDSNLNIPFKILIHRETLAYRVSELTKAALQLYESDLVVPAFIMTRAVVETASLLFSLHKQVRQYCKDRDAAKLNAVLLKTIMGSKDNSTDIPCDNILNSVDKMNKEFPGMREGYETLCEYTHPNWAGVLGSYGTINDDCLSFEDRRTPKAEIGLSLLVPTIVIFLAYSSDLIPSIYLTNVYLDSPPGYRISDN